MINLIVDERYVAGGGEVFVRKTSGSIEVGLKQDGRVVRMQGTSIKLFLDDAGITKEDCIKAFEEKP